VPTISQETSAGLLEFSTLDLYLKTLTDIRVLPIVLQGSTARKVYNPSKNTMLMLNWSNSLNTNTLHSDISFLGQISKYNS
jgi:hypothetical protein